MSYSDSPISLKSLSIIVLSGLIWSTRLRFFFSTFQISLNYLFLVLENFCKLKISFWKWKQLDCRLFKFFLWLIWLFENDSIRLIEQRWLISCLDLWLKLRIIFWIWMIYQWVMFSRMLILWNHTLNWI